MPCKNTTSTPDAADDEGDADDDGDDDGAYSYAQHRVRVLSASNQNATGGVIARRGVTVFGRARASIRDEGEDDDDGDDDDDDDDDVLCGMAASNASPARSSDDDDDDDDEADVVHPWAKKRRRDVTPPSVPKRGTHARDVVREKVLAAMRERAEAREDARDAQEEELATKSEDATQEDATPTLTRNENNQWSYRESMAVFESNDDVVAKLRARARIPSEREKRSLVLRAKAERAEAQAETFDVGAVVGAAERENQRNESRGRW